MPRYSYAARDIDGIPINGIIEAIDRHDVRERLRRRGFYVTSIKDAHERQWHKYTSKIKTEEIAAFAEQLAVMLDAGLHLTKCLTTLAEQNRNTEFKRIIEEVRRDIESGASLTDSIAKHPKVFSRVFISLIRTGEVGGVLDKVLRQIADYLDKEQQTRQQIKSALIYPKIVIVVCLATAVFMLSFVVPRFSAVYTRLGLSLPLPTIILVNSSKFLLGYWWVFPGAIIAILILYKKFSISSFGREIIDRIKLYAPVFGDLNRKVSVSQFVRVLGTLDSSGIPIMQSLEIASQIVENVVISRIVNGICANVKAGGNLEEPISASKLFPAIAIQMISAGEQSGRLAESLVKCANYLEREVDATAKRLIARIEPSLTIIMAGIVGLFAVAIYLPMFDIVKMLGR